MKGLVQIRKYAAYSFEEIVRMIRTEVMSVGYSEGWAGDFETVDALKEALRDDRIGYVDDLFGRWEKLTGAA